MNEEDVQEELAKELIRKGHYMVIPNTRFISQGEADLVSITQSGYLHEYEIKTDRGDFLAELRAFNGEGSHSYSKYYKHAKMRECNQGGSTKKIPAKFWVVAPLGVVDEQELPEYWGYYEIRNSGGHEIEKVVKANAIHGEKADVRLLKKLGTNLTKRYWKF